MRNMKGRKNNRNILDAGIVRRKYIWYSYNIKGIDIFLRFINRYAKGNWLDHIKDKFLFPDLTKKAGWFNSVKEREHNFFFFTFIFSFLPIVQSLHQKMFPFLFLSFLSSSHMSNAHNHNWARHLSLALNTIVFSNIFFTDRIGM